MEVALDVTSADEIDDPVRPVGALVGLFYRGSGHTESEDAAPFMHMDVVDDGDPPRPGDLVVFSIRARSSPSWALPSGWTLIDTNPGGERESVIFKEIVQSDIDSPPQPLGSAGTGLPPMAAAFFGVPVGILTIVLVSQITPAPTPERMKIIEALRRPASNPLLNDYETSKP